MGKGTGTGRGKGKGDGKRDGKEKVVKWERSGKETREERGQRQGKLQVNGRTGLLFGRLK